MKSERPSPFVVFSLAVFAISLLLVLASRFFRDFAVLVNLGISARLRTLFLPVSNMFSGMILESLLVFSPFLIFFVILYLVRSESMSHLRKRALRLVAVFLLFVSMYSLTLGVGYFTVNNPEREEPSLSEISKTAEILSAQISKYKDAAAIDAEYIPPLLYDSFSALDTSKLAPTSTVPRIKSFRSEKLASRLGLLGTYSFFTSEIAVNWAAPEYTALFSAAHEMAHLFGISDEGEANYYAYLALMNTAEPRLCYSASLVAFQYVSSELYKLDEGAYFDILSSMPETAILDLAEYRDFFADNSGTLYSVSSRLNDGVNRIWNNEEGASYSRFSLYIISELLSDL